MTIDQRKQAAAAAACAWIADGLKPDSVIGVGTGSTADHFIDLLAATRDRFAGAVASSSRTAQRLAGHGIRVFDLNDVDGLRYYIDGADEVDGDLSMIKGGGGALTREKIVAAAATTFVCIADDSKRVDTLGRFPLPVEIVPMARAQVMRALAGLGRALALGDGVAHLRLAADGSPYMTDNAGCIVDVAGWTVADPRRVEIAIGEIVGVVESGLFARRGADVLLLAGPDGVTTVRADR